MVALTISQQFIILDGLRKLLREKDCCQLTIPQISFVDFHVLTIQVVTHLHSNVDDLILLNSHTRSNGTFPDRGPS